jgi:hypothetical protein
VYSCPQTYIKGHKALEVAASCPKVYWQIKWLFNSNAPDEGIKQWQWRRHILLCTV